MEMEPMPRLRFAGAMLTGLGAILLLHGGSTSIRRAVADTIRLTAMPDQSKAIVPSLGGLAMTAGVMLAGLGARRHAS
jgi:hypothetical protein